MYMYIYIYTHIFTYNLCIYTYTVYTFYMNRKRILDQFASEETCIKNHLGLQNQDDQKCSTNKWK